MAAATAAAALLVPAFAGVPRRLGRGCGAWLALAASFELVSALGFVAVFKLAFAERLGWARGSRLGLCVLAATTVLPAGGLVGPLLGGWVTRARSSASGKPASRAVAFVLVTNLPNVVGLAGFGFALWLSWLRGPHAAALTLVPAAAAVAVLVATAFLAKGLASADNRRLPVRALRDGAREAQLMLGRRNWKLGGAFAYYAFDNAVLWAAFRAFGQSPPLGVLVMAYLVGLLGGVLPLPAGVGGTEAGLLGALVLYGTPAAPAAAAVLVYRSITLSVPLILGTGAYVLPRSSLYPSRLPADKGAVLARPTRRQVRASDQIAK